MKKRNQTKHRWLNVCVFKFKKGSVAVYRFQNRFAINVGSVWGRFCMDFCLSWLDLTCSGLFWFALACSGLFWLLLACSALYGHVLACPGLFWLVLVCSDRRKVTVHGPAAIPLDARPWRPCRRYRDKSSRPNST